MKLTNPKQIKKLDKALADFDKKMSKLEKEKNKIAKEIQELFDKKQAKEVFKKINVKQK